LPNMTKDLNKGVATASEVLSGGLDTLGLPPPQLQTTVIEPSRGWVPLKLSQLWEYREVLYFLVWRDIKVRYRQTLIGVTWAIIQPFMTMVVFSVFFGRLAKIPSDGTPYPLFAFAALVPWTFFANGLTLSANSLVHSGHLITKVYFPRLLVPTARVLTGLPDLVVSFLVLLGMIWWYGLLQSRPALMWLPALALLAFVTALGVGLWLSALNVQYRDIQHAVPFAVQLWLFATPIAYPSSLLPGSWRTVYGLNPMVGVVEGFRWTLLGSGSAPGPMLAASALAALVILVTGAFFFRRVERTFADVV
jgi:lipopolysaccharide transport system permease protein